MRVDDVNIPDDLGVTEAQVETWEKEIAEEKRLALIEQREKAEAPFRERTQAAFLAANPNATEQDFERIYPDLRRQLLEEATRQRLRQAQPDDDLDPFFRNIQELSK